MATDSKVYLLHLGIKERANGAAMKVRIVILVLVALILVIFALQNTEIVLVKLLFWQASIPRALLILICIAVGVIIGLIVPSSSKKKSENPEIE